jgi:integrase
MAKQRDKLTDKEVKNATISERLRKLSDGRGLQLWIMPTGAKYWRLEFRHLGRRKLLALGTYPDVSLASARDKADAARRHITAGNDPSLMKRQQRARRDFEASNTFSLVAGQLVEKKRKEGRAEVTLAKMQWIIAKLQRDFGSLPIEAIRAPEIVRALQREEANGNLETARRMRTVIGEVFRFAMQLGLTSSDPSVATRGVVANPAPKHHPAILDEGRFGQLLTAIQQFAETHLITGAALQLMAYLYPRPGELRQADWSEFDLAKRLWHVPAIRMKTRDNHVKPLPDQAVKILQSLRLVTGPKGFAFPAVGRPNRPMSENTMNAALKRLGFSGEEHCPHGFRATASTFLNASNRFSADAVEHSLAHRDKDVVRRAYARGDALSERVPMAQWWANHVDELRDASSSKIVRFGSP